MGGVLVNRFLLLLLSLSAESFLMGCDGCKRTPALETRLEDGGGPQDAGVPLQDCIREGAATVLTQRDLEFGEALVFESKVHIPIRFRAEDGGAAFATLVASSASDVAILPGGALEREGFTPQWVYGAPKPVLTFVHFEKNKRSIGFADAAARVPWPDDSLSYAAMETPTGRKVVRALRNSIDVVDVKTGKSETSLVTTEPEQVAVRMLRGRMAIVWTAGTRVELDGGDYLEAPGELRTERWLESAFMNVDASTVATSTRLVPREKHIADFTLLESGELIASGAEESREGEGTNIYQTNLLHPETVARLASNAGGSADAVMRAAEAERPRVFYWSPQGESYLASSVADAPPVRLPSLDRARVLGSMVSGSLMVFERPREGEQRSEIRFFRCPR
jgi:hypothetical protein